MATIADIIENRGSRAGSNGAWTVDESINVTQVGRTYVLRHYSTTMLTWHDSPDGTVDIIHAGLGWGSVSDQDGMNTAFRVLNLPLHYSRAGGAHINPSWVLDEYSA